MLRRLLAAIAILALLAGCGGGGSGNDGTGGTTAEGDVDSTSTTEASESGGVETLADFLGGNEDPEAAQAEYQDQEARRQELIRTCMADEGFDYTPAMPPEGSFQAFGPGDEEEMARTQGFGISTWYGNEDQFGADQEMEWVDPNQEMIEAMSDSERDAYYTALHGTEEERMEGARTETDPETGDEITIMEGFGAGCDGEANEEIYGDQSQVSELWEEIGPEMEAMQERVQADPRIVEWNQDWSACMAEAGYEYESQQNMYESVYEDFQERFNDIVGPDGGYGDPFEGMSEEEVEAFFEDHTQDEIDAFFEEAQEAAQENIDQEALGALQQEEIDLAVANFECGSDYNELYQEVAADYEADFIAENRDVLEQIRDAQGG